MAVAAIDPVVGDVVQVAELERLLDELIGAGHIRRAPDHHDQADEPAYQEKNADNTDLRDDIGAAVENLRHRMLTDGRPLVRTTPFLLLRREGDGRVVRRGPNPSMYHVVKKGSSHGAAPEARQT